MKQIELANRLSIGSKHLSDLKHGRRNISPKLAKKLEKITGISRFKWLYPGEYGDPWSELKKVVPSQNP